MSRKVSRVTGASEQILSSVQGQSYQATADARYAQAKRHSRRVRQLRLAVPVMVAAAMLTIVGISLFNPFRILSKLPIDIGKLGVSGTKITMTRRISRVLRRISVPMNSGPSRRSGRDAAEQCRTA